MKIVNLFLMTLFLFFIFLDSSVLKAEDTQPQNQSQNQNTQQSDDQPSLILTVLRGNPQEGGGELQEYPLTSGNTVFVRASSSNDAKKPQIDIAFEKQMNQLSGQISQKITNMDQIKNEYNNEIFPAFQPDLELDRQAQAADLRRLELERERIEADHRIKESERRMREAAMRSAPPTRAAGVNIQVNLEDENLSFVITPKGLKTDNASETTIQSSLGKWVKVLGKEDTEGRELWIKAELAAEDQG